MLYPANLEQKINFVKIKELLKAECTSPLGQSYVDSISFSADFTLASTKRRKRLRPEGK